MRVLGVDLGYPLAPVMSYTPYVLPVTLVAAVVAGVLRQWYAAAVAFAAALILLGLLLPRAVGGPDEDAGGRPLSVMASNVLRGEGDLERLMELIRDNEVEVLALQEVTPEFAREFDRTGGRELFPHRVLKLRRGVSGNGLYSRYPLRQLPVDEPETHLLFAEMRVAPGLTVEVASVHPLAPSGPRTLDGWRRGLEAMPRADPGGRMRILLGDFNAGFDIPQFRDVVDSGYEDAAEQLGSGLLATWPTNDKPFRFLPVTLDHVLYDKRVGAREFEAFELPGSDHKAVYAQLVLPVAAGP